MQVAEGSLRELKSLDGILSKQKKAAAQTKVRRALCVLITLLVG